MNCLDGNICHIETGGFAFGKAAEHLRTAEKAIIVRDCDAIRIKMDNRGPAPVRKRNQYGGYVVGGCNDARSTGRIGRYYRFNVDNGWIYIDLREEVRHETKDKRTPD